MRLRWTALLPVSALVLLACGGRPTLDLPVVVRHHPDVLIAAGSPPRPVFFDAAQAVGACVEVPDLRDTSRWHGTLFFDRRPSPDGPVAPAARLGRTVCFDALPPELEPSDTIELCLEIVDRFNDATERLRCSAIAFHPDRRPALERAMKARATLLRGLAAQTTVERAAALDAFSAEARGGGFPRLAINAELIAAHYLTVDGTPESLQAAGQRLEALPAWIERPELSLLGATAALQRANLFEAADRSYERVWPELEEAERRFLLVARPERFTVALRRADILDRLGATREAREQLAAVLSDCQAARCNETLLVQAKGELAWLMTLDHTAGRDDLEQAGRWLEQAASSLQPERLPIEHAILQANLAFVRLRLGGSPRAAAQATRAVLEIHGAKDPRAASLLAWVDLAEALAALESGHAEDARSVCRQLAFETDPGLATWALSCVGRAERQRGDLPAALRAFDAALDRHARSAATLSSERADLSPGRRADDAGRAARAALELGATKRAWRYLADLDRLAATEQARRRCRGSAGPGARQRWSEIDRRIETLYGELAQTWQLPEGARRESLQAVGDRLRQELRSLWREWPQCDVSPPAAEPAVRFRAVALDDEILLLERGPGDAVRLARRTPRERLEVIDLLDEVEEAMARRHQDADGWAALLRPLAEALLPPDLGGLEPVTAYALHGPLQRVPIAALPLPEDAGDARFVGQLTVIVHEPAGAGDPEDHAQAAAPLFIVDPLGDLAGERQATFYGELFPRARILAGERATSQRVLALGAESRWLHFDTHGSQEPGFPELSSLSLADRPLSLIELAGVRPAAEMVNLASCRAGRWPITADSGRYGIGGVLVRLGVPWVVAATGDLESSVADAFNRDFYRGLAAGQEIPAAFKQALGGVAERFPPASWAPLIMLRSSAARENELARTPSSMNEEEVVAGAAPPGTGEERK